MGDSGAPAVRGDVALRLLCLASIFLVACGDDVGVDADAGSADGGAVRDAEPFDAGDAEPRGDLGASDLGPVDLGPFDLGAPEDAGAGTDAGLDDLGADGGPPDLGPPDLGPPDLGPPDLGPPDLGPPDLGPPAGGCISGALGTHAARFRWNGTSSGSTAWISYETNTLPDTSRWRAGAYSSNFSYRPVWGDPFLGEGGLDMGGTVFMDVELSTQGLSSIRNVTIAVYGRSYSTGSSGSFSWQTFDGTGASPYGSMANSAPYQWYRADATAAFTPGNGGILLRIRPEGPSNHLVVNRVEICFDAS